MNGYYFRCLSVLSFNGLGGDLKDVFVILAGDRLRILHNFFVSLFYHSMDKGGDLKDVFVILAGDRLRTLLLYIYRLRILHNFFVSLFHHSMDKREI